MFGSDIIRIKIKGYLKNITDNEIFEFEEKGIKNKDKITFNNNNVKYSIKCNNSEIILIRDGDDFVNTFVFNKKNSNSNYLLKENGYDMDMEVEYHSTMDNSYISQADCFIELEDYENAIKSLDKALNICPENFTTIKSKGDCYFNLKQYQKALETMKMQ